MVTSDSTSLTLPTSKTLASYAIDDDKLVELLSDEELKKKQYNNKYVIGLTGALGSGVSHAAILITTNANYQFRAFKLSKIIKEFAQEKLSENNPSRTLLQDLGNELRKINGNDYLAKKIFEQINQDPQLDQIVIEGIRHPAEVDFFRKQYPNFYLIAIDAPLEERWNRSRIEYSNNKVEFEKIDQRDQEEALSYGQKVKECTYLADISIVNDKYHSEDIDFNRPFQNKLADIIKLIFEPGTSKPKIQETLMTLAYIESLRSFCIKRRVGAVITDESGGILSTGYNNPPKGVEPCRICYRTEKRDQLKEKITVCPFCGQELTVEVKDNGKCNSCLEDINMFIGKRLDECKALHAEERSIIQLAKLGSGISLEGKVIYTTTFPCLLCANKIVDAKISKVYYDEPYPMPEAFKLLNERGVGLFKFEGVKAQAFFKLYYQHVS